MKKYVLFATGVFLSLFGFASLIALSVEIATAPKDTPLGYLITFFGVFVTIISGIALCIFVRRKWFRARRQELNSANAEVGKEKPVDPAAAAMNRRTTIVAIVLMICGVCVALPLSNFIMRQLDLSSNWKWPLVLIIILSSVVGAILGTKIYRKKVHKTALKIADRISDNIAQKTFKDKQ